MQLHTHAHTERELERKGKTGKRDNPSANSLPKWSQRPEPGQAQGRSQVGLMETEAKPFPRQLAGNWIWSGAARTWTGRSTGNSFTCFTRTPASAYTFTHIFFYTMRMVCQVEDRFVTSKISVYFIMQRKAGWKLTVNRIQWEGKKKGATVIK